MVSAAASDAYDYVIVGGGSSGCVLAHRLSARPQNRVLLIEAGKDTPPGQVPAEILDTLPAAVFHGTKHTWPGLMVTTTPIGHNSGERPPTRFYEQGRVMGGGSSINAQVANRGLPRDYDEWERRGAEGWNWDKVLPYFKKLERDLDFDGPMHGKDGPLPIGRTPRDKWPVFAKVLAETYKAAGYEDLKDQNGDRFDDGYFPVTSSQEDGHRVSVAMAYLTPDVRQRPNLTILPETKVRKILFEGKRAIGVTAETSGGERTFRAGKEVILTAGALQTPAFLMRAGIGPADHLKSHGIDVLVDRPGVGQDLQDHVGLYICAYLKKASRPPRTVRKPQYAALRFSSSGEGALPSDLYITAGTHTAWHGMGRRLAYFFVWLNKPYSTGRVTLTSPEAGLLPQVEFDLLSDSRDMARLSEGARFLSKLTQTAPMRDIIEDAFPAVFNQKVREMMIVNPYNTFKLEAIGTLLDGPKAFRKFLIRKGITGGTTLADLAADPSLMEEYLRTKSMGVWHPSCTAKMGRADDPRAVVDPQGRVYGIEGLRVSDASVMPNLPTANTNIPTIMIAEKIADAILSA